jgi:MFS family permease
MSVIGGRLLLKIGYRVITLVGFIVLTAGFCLLAMFGRDTAQYHLYLDLVLIGAGLGLTMLTLLIAVQQAVERNQLGIATSLNQFSRAIGGAFGVAVMGAVLTAGLAGQLQNAAVANPTMLTVEQANSFASNPNALIDPQAKASVSAETLSVLQQAMAGAIRPVFWLGAFMSILAFVVTLFLPKPTRDEPDGEPSSEIGETMLMAEQTTINARNQPVAQ